MHAAKYLNSFQNTLNATIADMKHMDIIFDLTQLSKNQKPFQPILEQKQPGSVLVS